MCGLRDIASRRIRGWRVEGIRPGAGVNLGRGLGQSSERDAHLLGW